MSKWQQVTHSFFIDYLTPNETEARICLGLPPDETYSNAELSEKLLASGCRHVIITLGEMGVYFRNDGGVIEFPALDVAVVDTTGAGDAFNATLAAALANGQPIEDAISYAIVGASLSTKIKDTIPSYVRSDAIKNEYLAAVRGL